MGSKSVEVSRQPCLLCTPICTMRRGGGESTEDDVFAHPDECGLIPKLLLQLLGASPTPPPPYPHSSNIKSGLWWRRLPPGGWAALHGSELWPGPRVALELSGCGVYDRTEIHEASVVLVHQSRGGAEVQIFAPDFPQMHVVDHVKGQPSESKSRNVLAESARTARGKITSLAQLSASNHDAAIFPGGFGAAKNLSTFAVDGKDYKVDKDVEQVLKEFHAARKPIGLCCIAPVLAAKVLRGVEVTVGHEQEEGGKWPYAGTAEAIKALGAKHCVKGVTEAHVDQKNRVVTTPAFMCETALHHIHDGIGAMVKKVLELTGK
ncbi:glutamine amidotransferase-like class 1 domain-containing protein 3, mitochondrial [Perognathus longimembris pacificus]|uniref:glutamine amidotransferase-like class 1 domain-containing protein 3, mitochondrial n=1 Tax=Perognathus longimembris pacificus TaxID=214514 RepID=UPI002018FDED|nr:glutamine amidotransferase-like class 1 domain-containing protein 3, mitochondrial [Perognathus longimembris pacificus]